MAKIMSIPGIQWAADLMTGQKPLPERPKEEDRGAEGFEELLEAAMKEPEGGRG